MLEVLGRARKLCGPGGTPSGSGSTSSSSSISVRCFCSRSPASRVPSDPPESLRRPSARCPSVRSTVERDDAGHVHLYVDIDAGCRGVRMNRTGIGTEETRYREAGGHADARALVASRNSGTRHVEQRFIVVTNGAIFDVPDDAFAPARGSFDTPVKSGLLFGETRNLPRRGRRLCSDHLTRNNGQCDDGEQAATLRAVRDMCASSSSCRSSPDAVTRSAVPVRDPSTDVQIVPSIASPCSLRRRSPSPSSSRRG